MFCINYTYLLHINAHFTKDFKFNFESNISRAKKITNLPELTMKLIK